MILQVFLSNGVKDLSKNFSFFFLSFSVVVIFFFSLIVINIPSPPPSSHNISYSSSSSVSVSLKKPPHKSLETILWRSRHFSERRRFHYQFCFLAIFMFCAMVGVTETQLVTFYHILSSNTTTRDRKNTVQMITCRHPHITTSLVPHHCVFVGSISSLDF